MHVERGFALKTAEANTKIFKNQVKEAIKIAKELGYTQEAINKISSAQNGTQLNNALAAARHSSERVSPSVYGVTVDNQVKKMLL